MSELNLIIMGAPGAGKGTQAENLVADFELAYLATGDMMRAARKEDSDLGRKIAKIISEGGLVDDDIVIEVLLKRIEAEGQDGFLLDGFPRTSAQADALDEALKGAGKSLTAVLMIDVPDDEIIKRMSGRRVCEKGHTYHVEFNPPEKEGVCDIDGLPLEQRDDDKPETVKARLATYHEQTEPQAARYDDLGLLRRFDGTQSPEEVHHHIRSTVRTLRLEEEL
ncbi:MAG: adenylate kinase [Solirubrobacteraceae bacterium]|nr:adenylate kinase [Solirubrobacteraceae bacterium]